MAQAAAAAIVGLAGDEQFAEALWAPERVAGLEQLQDGARPQFVGAVRQPMP
jgi:hypothetical protein